MIAIRSHFAPDNIEGIQVGDTVYFHVTNLEQDWDIPHGFAVLGANNSELIMMPGETRTLDWVPTGVGVFPFYCTDFCSALHQEMQGYIRVSPQGSKVRAQVEQPELAQAQSTRRTSTPTSGRSDARHDPDSRAHADRRRWRRAPAAGASTSPRCGGSSWSRRSTPRDSGCGSG